MKARFIKETKDMIRKGKTSFSYEMWRVWNGGDGAIGYCPSCDEVTDDVYDRVSHEGHWTWWAVDYDGGIRVEMLEISREGNRVGLILSPEEFERLEGLV